MIKSIIVFLIIQFSVTNSFCQSEEIVFTNYELHTPGVDGSDSVEVNDSLNIGCILNEYAILVNGIDKSRNLEYVIISKENKGDDYPTIYNCVMDEKEFVISLASTRAFLIIENNGDVIILSGKQ